LKYLPTDLFAVNQENSINWYLIFSKFKINSNRDPFGEISVNQSDESKSSNNEPFKTVEECYSISIDPKSRSDPFYHLSQSGQLINQSIELDFQIGASSGIYFVSPNSTNKKVIDPFNKSIKSNFSSNPFSNIPSISSSFSSTKQEAKFVQVSSTATPFSNNSSKSETQKTPSSQMNNHIIDDFFLPFSSNLSRNLTNTDIQKSVSVTPSFDHSSHQQDLLSFESNTSSANPNDIISETQVSTVSESQLNEKESQSTELNKNKPAQVKTPIFILNPNIPSSKKRGLSNAHSKNKENQTSNPIQNLSTLSRPVKFSFKEETISSEKNLVSKEY
jgi:hypothetical protein